ncbi:MAG: matrixin family metalloprotease [Terriglobia bacterium]
MERVIGLRAVLCVLAVVGFTAVFLFAYTHEQDDVSGPVVTKWCNGNLNNGAPCANSVTWNLNPSASNVITTGGVPVLQALQNSFVSWENASLNSQSLVNVSISQGLLSETQTTPNANDCVNIIGFTDGTKSDFSTGTIAFTDIATTFGGSPNQYSCNGSSVNYTCPLPSCIVDADIEFNPSVNFSTASPTPSNAFDLQSIATHEIGHFLGMDHSGLASSIMFAFGDSGGVPQRNLSADDAIGIGSIYPSSGFAGVTGTLSGTVTLSGSGILGAHIVIMDTQSGLAATDTLTNSDGTYSIFVAPGQYNVIALPLAGLYDVNSYGGWACGYEENGPPCCDSTQPSCNAKALSPPTNFSGKFK